MKSEPFQFSPTSAGVRIEHLNFTNDSSNNSSTKANKGSTKNAYHHHNNNNSGQRVFSLPRPRALNPTTSSLSSSQEDRHPLHKKFVDLEHVIVHNGKDFKKDRLLYEKSLRKNRKSNKMRNSCIVTGVIVLVGLLSFILLVECRSVRVSPKKQYDAEVSSESRIQDASTQDPDTESSEEHPAKVVSTTAANKGASSSSSSASPFPSKSTTTRATGRLTRSRVTVVCKGGYVGAPGESDDDPSYSTPSTSTSTRSSSTTGKAYRKSLDLPTLLPRESDGNTEEDDRSGEKGSWGESDEGQALNSEETQQHVVTLTGYSHVTGGRPQTKSTKSLGSSPTTIKYVPKPSPTKETTIKEDDSEATSSSEEVEIVSVKPKTKQRSSSRQEHRQQQPKASKSSSSADRKRQTVSGVGSSTNRDRDAIPTTRSSTQSRKEKKHSSKSRQSKKESSEEEGGEESVESPSTRRPKHHRSSSSSKRSEAKHVTSSSSSHSNKRGKNEKGDSSEFDDDSIFPSLVNSERKPSSRKTSERKQRPPKPIPISSPTVDPALESAEAEPAPAAVRSKPVEVVSTSSSSSRKSSRSRKPDEESIVEKKRENSALKSVTVSDESSEEYNLEEAPRTKGKSKKTGGTISSSLSSSHRSSRMSSRTSAAPKMRTRMFSSVEEDD